MDRIDQIEPVLAAGVDTIMLDNFSARRTARRASRRSPAARWSRPAATSTSDTVRDIAETGVDVISVGALTHSVRALDLGLDMRRLEPAS